MPTFCRHNRFIERCPICSKTLPGSEPADAPSRPRGATRAGGGQAGPRRGRGEGLRVRREGRAAEDGYRSDLLPGLRASADARRLAEEIAFSSGRLAALAAQPPGLYAEARALAVADLERATWACFVLAYLSPSEDEDPFSAARTVLNAAPLPGALNEASGLDLDSLAVGPRSSHRPGRGPATLKAYLEWVRRGGRAGPGERAASAPGAQQQAFTGDPGWSPQRRFERLYERLALPGLTRGGRFEMLLTMGRLGLYELAPDTLHLGGRRGEEDASTLAAKRVFGIADPQLLERRAETLAAAVQVPRESLDLALFNWAEPQRATMGCPPDSRDEAALERAEHALGL